MSLSVWFCIVSYDIFVRIKRQGNTDYGETDRGKKIREKEEGWKE